MQDGVKTKSFRLRRKISNELYAKISIGGLANG
nr:MAG TPA: hypothetical protein [Caudoviricetes sp.]